MLSKRKVIAPAKVNLYLHVGAMQTSGLHEIDSLMVFADKNAADQLQFTPARQFELEIDGEFGLALSTSEENLIVKAFEKLQEFTISRLNYHVKLTKNIPIAAGLGGGSIDASTVIREFGYHLEIPAEKLIEIAKFLGSDVPACLLSQPCRVRGQGEIIRPLVGIPKLFAVLVNCRYPCSTARVFREFDQMNRLAKCRKVVFPDSFSDSMHLIDWLSENTANDLVEAATEVVPEINEVFQAMNSFTGLRLVRLSGSGVTCFGLCDSIATAQSIASEITKFHPDWWVRATQLG